jgi:hypothetical protein
MWSTRTSSSNGSFRSVYRKRRSVYSTKDSNSPHPTCFGQSWATCSGRRLALASSPVAVFPSRLVLEGALEIALETGRSVYDSVYVALAVALECPLVTADERLVNALAGGPLASHVLWVGVP